MCTRVFWCCFFKKSHIQSIGECPSVSLSLPAVVPYTGVCLLESWAGVGSDSRFFISAAAAAASARWRGFFLCCCALHLHLPPSRPQNRRSRSPRSLAAAAAAAAAAAIAFSPNPKKLFFCQRSLLLPPLSSLLEQLAKPCAHGPPGKRNLRSPLRI